MRLIYPDPNPIPDRTPSALQILQNVDALGQLGVDVTLLTPQSRTKLTPSEVLGRSLPPNVTMLSTPDLRRRWFFPTASNKPFYFMAGRQIRRERGCVLLVRNLRMAEYLLKNGIKHPLFFETHEIFAQTYREEHPLPNKAARRKLTVLAAREAFVYRNSCGLIAITQGLADDVRKYYRVDVPTLVAADGVDEILAGQALRHAANATPVLLYLGSLHPWKGVDVLVRAMQFVTGAILRIAGGVAARIDELRTLAKQLNVDSRVEFMGPIDPIARFNVIAGADICLLPSSDTSIGARFTSPLKLFEYLAMGKAIVASDLPALREILRHNETALLTAVGDAQKFADSINLLLANQELRERLGTNAKEQSRRYTWQARTKEILGFIQQLTAQTI
jgi:glycosyltransferase involved in cell wall biosynthesis